MNDSDMAIVTGAMRSAGYTEAARRLRRALEEAPGLTPLEAIELLEREAAEELAAVMPS